MSKALRQGDVLIRPIKEKIIERESAIDWNLVRAITASHMKIVQRTEHWDLFGTIDAINLAVRCLYNVLGRDCPAIIEFSGGGLDPLIVGRPIRNNIELISNALLINFPERDLLMRGLGYDHNTGQFRLASNKRLISPFFRVRRRIDSRPPWTVDLGNMICQFDRSALMLYDLAKELNLFSINTSLTALANAISQVLDQVFGVILFETTCIFIRRPLQISLDPTHVLSNTMIDTATMKPRNNPCPAITFPTGLSLFAVQGVGLRPELIEMLHTSSPRTYSTISSLSPIRRRSAAIQYVGWETFFEHVPRRAKQLVDKSRFGELWDFHCGDDDILSVVKVINATAEPDGTFRSYVIPVDAFCRPLPNPNDPSDTLGEVQFRSALNAVASTFGMTGKDYEAMIGNQS